MCKHILISTLLIVPLVLGFDSEEIATSIHGDFGTKISHGAFRDTDEILIQEETRVNRQIPLPLSSGLASVGVVPVVPTPVPVVEQHIHHHHIDHVVTHEEQVPEIDVWDIRDSVPGTPNEDYPVLRSIPKTRFSCDNKIPGYYADSDTKCQVFHRCSETEESARKKMDSFLCLNGTTFNQEILSCDWWENVRCEKATKFYGLNKELNMRGEDGKYIQLSAKREASGKKPLSPGIIPKDERIPLPPQFRSPLNRIQATETPIDADTEVDEEVDQVELEDPPPISEVQVNEVTTTETPSTDEDEDIAYFFTPEQIKNIRSSKDFGDRLTNEQKPNKTIPPDVGNLNSTNKETETKEKQPMKEVKSVRIPVYKSSQAKPKPKNLFQSDRREKSEGEELFQNKLREGKRQVSRNQVPTETKPKVQRTRKLRKINKGKQRKQKAATVSPTASLPLGFPYPAQQLIVAPNGTSKILKYKHLLHTDITESFPPYVSGVRPVVNPYQPYPYHPLAVASQNPYAPYPNSYGNTLQPFSNSIATPFQSPSLQVGPAPPASVTYEHHHHHTQGTHHKALEPHHVYPSVAHGSGANKLLAPHEVIPALYHPDVVGPTLSGKQSTKDDEMYLVQPHHALRAHPIAVNLGDRLAHHHHQVLPDNPLAAHHYAAESHLAVAAFHHLAEPHVLPPPLSHFTSNLPTVYSQQPAQVQASPLSAQPSAINPIYASEQSENPIYPLSAPQQQYPLTQLLGMINA